MLGYVVGHEMYYFMDGYSGHNQVKLAEEDKEKKTFILKWDAYAYNVIPFGLCKAFTTFLKMVTKTFHKHSNEFMKVFFDDFSMYGDKKNHFDQLQKCL